MCIERVALAYFGITRCSIVLIPAAGLAEYIHEHASCVAIQFGHLQINLWLNDQQQRHGVRIRQHAVWFLRQGLQRLFSATAINGRGAQSSLSIK
jgi:hypothetical protein